VAATSRHSLHLCFPIVYLPCKLICLSTTFGAFSSQSLHLFAHKILWQDCALLLHEDLF